MFTIAPPPCSRIRGTAALVQMKGPVRLTASRRFQSSSLVCISGADTATPAWSMRPLRAWLLDLSGRCSVLDGADDCGENRTGNTAAGHLADDAADIRRRGTIGEQRNQHAEELSPGAAADRARDGISKRTK